VSETAHPVFAPIYSYCLGDEGLSIPRHRGIVGMFGCMTGMESSREVRVVGIVMMGWVLQTKGG
jgi:hypothetical protein